MNKAELIGAIAESSGLTKKDSGLALDAFISVVQNTVASGEPVALVGFGTFKVRDRQEREGHNPKTKEKIVIPATKAPVFQAGQTFKDAVRIGY